MDKWHNKSDFIYFGNMISELKKDTDTKLQRYNKIDIIIGRHFDTHTHTHTFQLIQNYVYTS
jgi:hypothetical protein